MTFPDTEMIAAYVVVMLVIVLWTGWVDSLRKERSRGNRR